MQYDRAFFKISSFYTVVAGMWLDRFGRAFNGGAFWPQNRTFNAPKKMVKENSLGPLLLILNTAII